MKNGICYVVGAGENYGLDFCPATDDFVIAADAGLHYLEKQGIKADLVIGDFDTLKYIPKHPNVMALNTEKDDTDTFVAVREGIKARYDCFHIYCGTGGRIDHDDKKMRGILGHSVDGLKEMDCRVERIPTKTSRKRNAPARCFLNATGIYARLSLLLT